MSAACGTRAGHQAHKRRKEPPCQKCRDAHNTAQREWYRIREEQRRYQRLNAVFQYIPAEPLQGALCTPETHDSRHENEPWSEWRRRRFAAICTCRRCPALDACRQQLIPGVPVDGIVAGIDQSERTPS